MAGLIATITILISHGNQIGVLAQLVEQWTLNPFVASSILARPTNIQAASRALTLEAVFNFSLTDYV